MWTEIIEAPELVDVLTCFMVGTMPTHRKYRILVDGRWFDELGECEKPTHVWSDNK